MDLKIKDIVDLLRVSEKTVYQWIKENKIPAYKINHQYRFNKSEINDWILKNKISVSEKILDLNITKKPVIIADLIKKGGIFFNLEGSDIKDIIKNAVDKMQIPHEVTKNRVLSSLLERENMMPTAMGRGVAFPHPRNSIITDTEDESISLFRLKNEFNYGALDGIPVHTLFILISSTPQRHLHILSRLSYLCQSNDFILLLKKADSGDMIVAAIEEKEREWEKLQ